MLVPQDLPAADDHPSDHAAGALDDIFGDDDDDNNNNNNGNARDPSDIPRLSARHTTEGYREGYTAAKATSVQVGFDEGYTLGATLGLRAGQLLGMVEAVVDALDPKTPEATAMLDEARAELVADSIFTPEYWAADGTWTYPVENDQVPSSSSSSAADVVLFRHVADAHPIIQKWDAIVNTLVDRWQINRSIFDGDDVDEQPAEPVTATPVYGGTVQMQPKVGSLDW